LKDSTAALADGADQVASGTAQLAKKAPTLASGAKRIDQATGQLADGTSQLKQNMPKLTAGSSALAKGTAQLSDSAPALANAVGQLASGADTLHSGTGQLTTATAKLAGATGDLVDGTQSADTGSKKLQDGLGQLADGADQLNDGLEDGVDQIPNYTGKDQDHLAKVNATPVSTDLAQHNSMGNYGTGLSPYFMSLALWIGGIGFFMLMAPLTERLLASRLPSILVALRSAWAPAIMAVVQAALVMTVVHLVIGIEMAHPMAVWLLAMFTSLTFLMVNQGLIAILGAPGRFLSLVMVVVQVASAGGTYPVQTMPHFLQGLRTIMPMSYTTQAFRSLIAGGPANGVGACVLALSIWLVFGLLLLVTATVLARRSDTVRDWATLAPGRPNGGRSVAPAVAVTPSAAMPDDAEQDRELVAVGAATGAATAGDGEAASGRHAAAAASATGPGDEPVAPISTLSNELLEEPSGEADPSPEAESPTVPAPEASDTTQELPEASEPQEHNETEEKKEND
jgi:putative membrane protein